MALNRLKGITIEIGADSTPLQKAIKEINSTLRQTQSELKDIDNLLKLDPTNTELLRQKQQSLKDAISETEKKLDAEKEALRKLKEGDQTPEVVKQQQNLEREIIDTEKSLKNLKNQMKDFGSVAKQQLTAVGDKMKAVGTSISNLGDKMIGIGRSMSLYVTTPIVGGFASAVKSAAEFDKQMSAVSAVSGATADEFDDLRDAAMEWGEKSVFSAKESADALYYMGLAGWNAKDSMDALGGVLELAAAGASDLGTTSDIVTDSMTAFNMSADQAGHFANVLAVAMSKSNTTTEMLGEAFKYAAAPAGALGYSVEDVSLAMGLMANSGIKASMAGTTLRTLFTNMVKPTDEMAMAMDVLGVKLDDGKGNMLSFEEVMQNLRKGFGDLLIPEEEFASRLADLDQALEDGTISEKEYDESLADLTEQAYGAEGALKAKYAAMLAGKRGLSGLLAIVQAAPEDYENLKKSISNADAAFVKHGDDIMTLDEAYEQFGDRIYADNSFEMLGAAAGIAAKQIDNLSGDWTLFTSALGTTKIEISDLVKNELRGLVSRGTELLKMFNSLSDEEQGQIVKIAGVVAAIAPALLILGTLAKAIGSIISLGGTLVSGIGALSGFLTGTLIPALGSAAAWITGTAIPAVISFAAAFAPFLIGGAIIAGIVAAGVYIYKHWDEIKAKAGELKDKITEKWTQMKTNISNKWNEIKSDTDKKLDTLKNAITKKVDENGGGIGGVIKTAVEGYKKTWELGFTAIDKLTDGKLSTALNTVKNKVGENGGGIGGVIKTALDGYVKYWDLQFTAMDKITGGKFTDIFDKIKEIMNKAKDFVKDVIDKIVGFFKFEWSLPKLKLPHIRISGEFSLLPPKVPTFSIDWYKKAYNSPMMFSSPTVIPTASGLKGFGDGNGAEIVVGANNLMGMISEAAGTEGLSDKVDALTTIIGQYLPVIAQGGDVYLDRDRLVGEITPDINRRLGLAYSRG